MNRRVSTTEVEKNLTAILHDVEEGESFVITLEGQDVARISPVEGQDVARISAGEAFDVNSERAKQARKELFERLAKTEAIDIGPWTRAELYEDGE
jgi:antitoxin (DNA-binding transcriptional repressor) of toxin-antitoxin stability system